MKKKRSLTTRALVNKLDRIFSKYIRLRDADETGSVKCVTCGRLFHWREVHAGHWVKRQHQFTRFDERNVAAQCVRDNLHMGGRQDDFAKYILDRYGLDTLNELLANKQKVKKWTREELTELIDLYTERVNTLESRLSGLCE